MDITKDIQPMTTFRNHSAQFLRRLRQHVPRRDLGPGGCAAAGDGHPDQLGLPGLLHGQLPVANLGELRERDIVQQHRLPQDLVQQGVGHRGARVAARPDVVDRGRAEPGDVVDLLATEVVPAAEKISVAGR